MARNLQFQVLRGTQAQLSSLQAGVDPDSGAVVSPLALGEMYFATDTNTLFFGTPGVGLGYIQLGDTTQVQEKLEQLIVLQECTRRAMVALICGERGANPEDFSPRAIAKELNLPDGIFS